MEDSPRVWLMLTRCGPQDNSKYFLWQAIYFFGEQRIRQGALVDATSTRAPRAGVKARKQVCSHPAYRTYTCGIQLIAAATWRAIPISVVHRSRICSTPLAWSIARGIPPAGAAWVGAAGWDSCTRDATAVLVAGSQAMSPGGRLRGPRRAAASAHLTASILAILGGTAAFSAAGR